MLLPKAVTDSILHTAFDRALHPHGFVRTGNRVWVRSSKPQIRDVVSIAAMKGFTYTPCWGFSLDYVPHVAGSAVKWHRTAKSARSDWCYNPYDDNRLEIEEWEIKESLDRNAFLDRTSAVAKRVVGESLPVFDRVVDIASLRLEFESWRNRPSDRFTFDHSVQGQIAYAFTLALLGEKTRAEPFLRKYISFLDVHPDELPKVTQKIIAHFEAAARTGFSKHRSN